MRSRGATALVVHRTTRVALRPTAGQRRRLFGMLRAGGDVWAALIEMNEARFRKRARPIMGYVELCREVAGVAVGELSVTAIRSVVRRYSQACTETARRKRNGERARYPRRRRALVPLTWYAGTFAVDGRRVRLSMADGAGECWVRVCREPPYDVAWLRSVRLVPDGGRLSLDVTAEVPVEHHGLDPGVVAGVDLGIIHPYAVAVGDQALVCSGRALRAEERLHLEDTKRRSQRMGRSAPRRGQRGSRRWRTLRGAQRRAGRRHRDRVRTAHHQAAAAVVAWLVEHRAGTIAIGDPKGITGHDAGRQQNLRLRQWRRTHLIGALADKARRAGITVVTVDERGTSSTCPECHQRAPKPSGRTFRCPHCSFTGHRDIVGARNIAAIGGGPTSTTVLVTHRRAGTVPARRDRRRHLFDARRSCPTPGRPPPRGGSRSPRASRAQWGEDRGCGT